MTEHRVTHSFRLALKCETGVLYLPDELLYTFAHLNKTAIETVCEVAEGLSKLDHCQRQADPSDPYDQLMGEYKNRIGDN